MECNLVGKREVIGHQVRRLSWLEHVHPSPWNRSNPSTFSGRSPLLGSQHDLHNLPPFLFIKYFRTPSTFVRFDTGAPHPCDGRPSPSLFLSRTPSSPAPILPRVLPVHAHAIPRSLAALPETAASLPDQRGAAQAAVFGPVALLPGTVAAVDGEKGAVSLVASRFGREGEWRIKDRGEGGKEGGRRACFRGERCGGCDQRGGAGYSGDGLKERRAERNSGRAYQIIRPACSFGCSSFSS